MVKVYTSKNMVKSNKEIVYKNDYFFDIYFKGFSDRERNIVKSIDNAEVSDNGRIVNTPYGECTPYEISTGSKTIINVLNNPDIIFDVTECGENALNYLFREINNSDVEIILRHSSFNIGGGIEFMVNNNKIIDNSFMFSIELDKREGDNINERDNTTFL